MQHTHWLNEAIRLAKESVATGGGPFAALVVKDGRCISSGMNRVTLMHDPTAHGEVMAIRQACVTLGTHDLAGCVLYSSCEPCPMCVGAIYWARLDACYFAATGANAAAGGFDDQNFHKEVALPAEQRSLPMRHIPLPDARAPFDAWAAHARRVRY